MQEKENEEKIVDIKGTLENFIEEEKPELTQEEAIKSYKGENQPYIKKSKKKKTSEEDEEEEDEYLKKLKKELLESLERVNNLAKKIFDEKDKELLKDIKVKSNVQKSKNREQVMEQMRAKVQEEREKQNNLQDKGRSREE